MVYDHAQSPRLGQPTQVESTSVRMFAGSQIPEAAWAGQIIYRTDTQMLQVFNGTAWEDVVGGTAGLLTYVGPDAPAGSLSTGDLWFDSDDGNKLYRWDGAAWVSVQDGSIATAVSTANTALSTANDASTAAAAKAATFISATIPTSISIGDIWYDSANGYKQYRAASVGANAITAGEWELVQDTAISTAQTTADGKNKIFYATSAPTATATNDLWFDTDDGYHPYIWNGSAWVDARDATIATAQSAATTAQSTADGKNKVFYAISAPTATATNDLWFDTDDGYKPYIWNGSAWVSVRDATIATAQSAATAAQTTADGKNTIFYSTSAPTATATSDLWFDTDDGYKPYIWSGSAWVAVRDATIATAQTTADGKNKIFYATTAPTATAVNDLWFDTDDGYKPYVWSGSAWVAVRDSTIAAAQTDATNALSIANGKNKVFFQISAPTASATGDLWYDTDDGNKLYQWSGSAWVAAQYGTSAIAANAITAALIAANTITAAQIAANTITASQIAADTLTANEIAANAITSSELAANSVIAGKIAAGVITAAEIAADTITASQIAANAITSSELAANSVIAGKIAAGVITAAEIAADTITASQIAASAITSSELAALAVIAGKIDAGAVTASTIAASAVTADAIAANAITTSAIAAGAVTADQIEANAVTADKLDAVIALLSQIIVGDSSGRSIHMSGAEGFLTVDSSGNTVVSIPTDSTASVQIGANLTAESMTATGQVSLRAAGNEVATGATVVMRAASTAPVSPPTATIVWNTVRTATDNFLSNTFRGAVFDGTYHQTVWSLFGDSGIKYRNRTTGAFIGDTLTMLASDNGGVQYNAYAAAKIGSYWYTLGQYTSGTHNSQWWVKKWGFPASGVVAVFQSEWLFDSTGYFSYDRNPTMTTDGTNLFIIFANSSDGGKLYFRSYTPTGTINGTTASSYVWTGALSGVMITSADFGASKYVVTTRNKRGGDAVLVFNASTVANESNYEWPLVAGDMVAGLVWDSTSSLFRQFSANDNTFTTYDGNTWVGASTQTWRVTNTWYDDDTTSGSATHETMQGPVASLAMKKRARLSVTTPVIPSDPNAANHDDPNSVRIYVGNGDGSRTQQWQQAAPAAGVRTAVIVTSTFDNTSGTHPNPPATSNFPASTPGKLTDDSGTYYLDGNGDGSLRDMTLRNLTVTAEVTKTGMAYREASGTVTNTALAAGTGTSVAVTFPTSRFTVAPNVMVTPSSNGYNAGSVVSITTSGCTARNFNPQTSAHTGTETIYWYAVQMTSAAASG